MKKILFSGLVAIASFCPTFGQQAVGVYKGDPVVMYYSPLEAFAVSGDLKFNRFELRKERILLSINNCGMLTTDLERTGLDCTINGHTTSYKISVPGYSAGLSEDCKFFVFSKDDSISIMKNGRLVEKIVGNSPQIIRNYIYYHYSNNKPSGLIDLYRVQLSNLKKKEAIVENIFDVGVLVFDDGNYVACAVPRDGGPQNAVYVVNSKEFRILMKANPANSPIYFPKTKSLRYLNITTNTFGRELIYR